MSGALIALLNNTPIVSAGNPVAGYTAWYAPDSIKETAGIVTAWNDKSANAFHYGTANNSPVYTSSAINGLAGMTVLHALNQYLTSTATLGNLITASAWTAYFVFKITAYTGLNNTTINGNNSVFSATSASSMCFGMGSSHLCLIQNDGADEVADGGAISTGITVIAEVYYNGSNIFIRVNGTDIANTVCGAITTTTGTLYCGSGFVNTCSATICEMLFYNTNLSGGNKTTNRTYLGTKYNGTG